MTLHVRSEIGRLRRVLIHKPGREIDWMVPTLMDHLLFDDILYGDDARWEHEHFEAVLRAAEVETFDPLGLLADVLADDGPRAQLLDSLQRTGTEQAVIDELASLSPSDLAVAAIGGLEAGRAHPGGSVRDFYRLAPLPNYFFQRDPQVVLGDRVLVSSMATGVRDRESLLSSLVFQHHPALGGWAEMIRLRENGGPQVPRRPMIEGGDVLVPRHDILMVGVSERTNRYGIDRLAKHLLGRGEETGFHHIVVVKIPSRRSYMHLDTVFTFIDHGLCLCYMPVIAPDGAEAGDVYRLDLDRDEVSYTLCDSLPAALGGLGMEIELVPCGGERLIDQQREQWTDGANAFALAPGVLVMYRRNRKTAEELTKHGFRVVEGDDVVDGKAAVFGHGRTAIVLDDNELSRARGGPRCMTMPLERDPV